MTKLDELRALMASHQANPELNYCRGQLDAELRNAAPALIAAVDALKKSLEWVNVPMQASDAAGLRHEIRAALKPFGE